MDCHFYGSSIREVFDIDERSVWQFNYPGYHTHIHKQKHTHAQTQGRGRKRKKKWYRQSLKEKKIEEKENWKKFDGEKRVLRKNKGCEIEN